MPPTVLLVGDAATLRSCTRLNVYPSAIAGHVKVTVPDDVTYVRGGGAFVFVGVVTSVSAM